jgi:hypothetical protein
VHGITGHNFETRHPSDDSDQVWFPLVLYFQRRRFLKKFTMYDGRQVMAIAHLTLWVRWAKNVNPYFHANILATMLKKCTRNASFNINKIIINLYFHANVWPTKHSSVFYISGVASCNRLVMKELGHYNF